MTQPQLPRRKFLKDALLLTSGVLLAPNFISCKDDKQVLRGFSADNFRLSQFEHGVASFDPTSSQVIIWTRYSTTQPSATLQWQLATDAAFTTILRQGEVTTDAGRDYTVAVEIQQLPAGQRFYYRFANQADNTVSDTGQTLTIAAHPSQVKLAICSCANYAAGLFNVYHAMANSDADIIVHLGDYIYEYGDGQYGTDAHTAALGRNHQPTHEILSLPDYRTRYRQYRTDKNLQLAHRTKPFICVWDDHEIANNTYKDGAENHQPNEGSFQVRKQAALQAYSEYLPFKSTSIQQIYRTFTFGSLLSLHMLDTRVIGREKQLAYADFMRVPAGGTKPQFDQAAFVQAWQAPTRTILGTTQRDWLINKVNGSNARWQVLGQQVLMGKLLIDEELMRVLIPILALIDGGGTQDPSVLSSPQFSYARKKLAKLATARRYQQETQRSRANAVLLPYNLDAWDGYPAEREYLYNAFNKPVISFAGDTHNAWYNLLKDNGGVEKGKELATASVSSPGFEKYLGFLFNTCPDLLGAFETLVPGLIADVEYVNASKRGFVQITFTQSQVTSEWTFVNTITAETYTTTKEKTLTL
ncbi:alkaline phosphatase D family protein [Chitinophaga pendula]|uniref:alkaline phosphatase D family protein n=1 Tax=Chitinophaga TaxID=79328 RepID=UPI000BAF01B4|nr:MULTISPECIES: alkaline phosphatase D family protein [Chitinophaga]ASZ13594.1 alkaline phosphatase [Chitinophaga sp. MD30]UCJ08783.1 alkaline phosphatase D family protein [Chitinophaga pendula]